jgi:HTH-type transcriptional regulator/antitoxin HigA
MATLKYTVIKTAEQYEAYCKELEVLIQTDNADVEDEIELLTLLIERYDEEHSSLNNTANPVELLIHLMEANALKAVDLALILGISKGYLSDILHYKKGISKTLVRKLAEHFKLNQAAFNRPYLLQNYAKKANPQLKSHNNENLSSMV